MKIERIVCYSMILTLLLAAISLNNKKQQVITKIITEKVPVKEEVIIEVEKEIEVIKEVEVVKEIPVYKPPKMTYNLTSEERELLTRIVYLEGGLESSESQRGIASVILNRLDNGTWGDTLKDVIYYPHQFSPAHLISSTTPTETSYEAVDYVLENGPTLPSHIMYFRAWYHFDADGYIPYISYDDTYFGGFEKDKK